MVKTGMVKKGDYMAEYRVPENQQSNIRKNEQSEIVTAKKAKTFTEEEVLALLEKAKEVTNG